MRTEFSTSSVAARVGVTVIVLSVIYMFFGPPSYVEVEMINVIFFLFIVPPILIAGTIFLSLLIGLPIRTISTWFTWWYARPYIALILLALGILLCFISVQSSFLETHVVNSEGVEVKATNLKILSVGWFITSLH